MKWQIIILILAMSSIVESLRECSGVMKPSEIPCSIISPYQMADDCATYTIQTFNSNTTLLDTRSMGLYGGSGRCNITFNYTSQDSYLMNWSSGDSSKIIVQGEDDMASLSVTIFIGAITLALFYIGIKHDFSKNAVANLIIKRCMILFGMFLVSLDNVIILTMADNAGLGVSRELFRFLWGVNWTIYLFMFFLALTTILNVLKLWEVMATEKRMGRRDELY